MSLADALSTPSARRRSTRCLLGQIIDSLATTDGAALETALTDPRYSTSAIHRALRAEGHIMARSTVVVHRNGGCTCGTV